MSTSPQTSHNKELVGMGKMDEADVSSPHFRCPQSKLSIMARDRFGGIPMQVGENNGVIRYYGKNSFPDGIGAGQVPPEPGASQPGLPAYMVRTLSPALRLEAFWREKKRIRDRKLNRARSRRFRARRRQERAIQNTPLHPTMTRQEVLAVEGAARIA